MIGKSVQIYCDDIPIYTPSIENHIDITNEVLSRLDKANLSINPSKSKIFVHSVEFLGHIISDKCFTLCKHYTDSIQKLKVPTSKKVKKNSDHA